MIQSLSDRYRCQVAWPLFIVFYLQFISSVRANPLCGTLIQPVGSQLRINATSRGPGYSSGVGERSTSSEISLLNGGIEPQPIGRPVNTREEELNIGGPTSPEASSFKAANGNDLVNLFTGDFSYSIPLMDVGGYPVNLFYSGGIGMEQEASWVGLGWNLNPGTVNRNMRGVPDDFNGTDLLTVNQNIRPNRTYGAELGLDVEILGFKTPQVGLGVNGGVSYNNYLGPELTLGTKLSLSLSAMQNVGGEKSALSSPAVTAGIGAKLSSRSGFTLAPSLSASLPLMTNGINQGIGLSTSYNSRTGIKELNISGQVAKTAAAGISLTPGLHSGTSISFAKPAYIPTLRMPMTHVNTSAQVEVGFGAYGVRGSLSGMGYYTESSVPAVSQVVKKPLVGYIYSERANSDENAVMDFHRLGDGAVTPNTPIIAAPQYDYDIFSIQGEGTGGTIRAYRGDPGFMRDNITVSTDQSISVGVDLAPPMHYGGNFNSISTPTKVGGWTDHTNTLVTAMSFNPAQPNTSFENVYFRNPAEATVTNPDNLARLGDDNLVQFQLAGTPNNVTLQPILDVSDKKTGRWKDRITVKSTRLADRQKRTQVTTMLNAEDAARIGLDTAIRSYSGSFDQENNIEFQLFSRTAGVRREHHISEITVLEQTGMRYVYGIPVYTLGQKDIAFSVKDLPDSNNLVSFLPAETTIQSPHVEKLATMYGYVQSQEIPPFASSFLLTSLLSPDFVDVTGNGVTEDDLGNAVKFNYTRSADTHKWRTPRNNAADKTAFFNEGTRAEVKDNKATISYGERESWYLKAIESKSMIAIFSTSDRTDAKGVLGPLDGRVNPAEKANKSLARIDLYTKASIKSKGILQARPLKSVFFIYDYSLCPGTPDNSTGNGKLTLKEIQFSYNGQVKSKDRYVFNYGNTNATADNPKYTINASDRWGTYKNRVANPAQLSNADHPYTSSNKQLSDQFAAAWSLKKILLPSGGQLEIQYEADDYGYTQDRRACDMFAISGLGSSADFTPGNHLYENTTDNHYVYVQLQAPLQSSDPVKRKAELSAKYLEGINQVAFRLQVKMPRGFEPVSCYASFDDYGLCPNNPQYFYIHLSGVENKSPLAKSAIGFLTGNIPAQAFPGYELEFRSLDDFVGGSIILMQQLGDAFKNVDQQMRSKNKAQEIFLERSFLRLCNPQKRKFGGGSRVKQVVLRDNWNRMTGQYGSVYGQDYEYTTREKIGFEIQTISSGVASYEPGIGSEENPFREILQFSDKLPLASAEYGAIEMPLLEGFYPSPVVGYSSVTVRSIHRKGTHGDSAVRSAIGKQVTEFYTAKDFPSFSTYTPMDSRDYHKDPLFSFYKKEIKDHRTISQGFLVETNDMHGKLKAQLAYSESDEQTPLSASYHTYKNTGRKGFADKVDFVYGNESGAVHPGNMGIDIELMTDVREFSVTSKGYNAQSQVDLFIFPSYMYAFPSFFPLFSFGENRYRSVTCTKLINYHAIEDSVIVMDKGSIISTKTILYDAETGAPIVTRTANEFNDRVFTTNYPAHWAYSSAGLAYRNIDLRIQGINFYDGRVVSAGVDMQVFESGDELYVEQGGGGSTGCIAPSPPTNRLWVLDQGKNTYSLSTTTPDYIFIDSIGRPFTRNGVSIRIVRSGRRNNLGLVVNSATSLKNPVQNGQLVVRNSSDVLACGAIEYKEKWQVDIDAIKPRNYFTAACNTDELDSIACTGTIEKKINPYLKGLIGNLKPHRSYSYVGSRREQDIYTQTAIRKDGAIKEFLNYWVFNTAHNLVPAPVNERWVWNTEVTKVNSKGKELETKDALDRHTAAQFGFDNNLAVAVIQNARYGEAFSDGFEDYHYSEAINSPQVQKCSKRYVDLAALSNSTVLEASSLGLNAHSGKYILKIPPGNSVKNDSLHKIADDFTFGFPLDTGRSLFQAGGSLDNIQALPAPENYTATSHFGTGTSIISGDYLMKLLVYNSLSAGQQYRYEYAYQTTQYIQIPADGTYEFYARQANNASTTFNTPTMVITISNVLNGIEVPVNTTSSIAGPGSLIVTMSACLKSGIYKITSTCSNQACITAPCTTGPYDTYELWFPDQLHLVSYRTLKTLPGCDFKKPIPANKDMMNATFSAMRGETMLFSAWVREDCGVADNAPCYDSTYTHTTMAISSDNNLVLQLKPAGPIIEGWQKLEGQFVLPANATTMKIELVNSNNKPLFLDDVRMHPFNANMKTYVYDPLNLRLAAELDENNHATFYEYDDEGQLVRIKKETIQGIKTIKETRTAKQKAIRDFF